jgi:hypothetical protein
VIKQNISFPFVRRVQSVFFDDFIQQFGRKMQIYGKIPVKRQTETNHYTVLFIFMVKHENKVVLFVVAEMLIKISHSGNSGGLTL